MHKMEKGHPYREALDRRIAADHAYQDEVYRRNSSWVPTETGVVNNFLLREDNERRWKNDARAKNASRSAGQKVTFRGKTNWREVMRDEANKDNEAFDAAQKDPELAGIPEHLYQQKLGEAILADAGIDPSKRFATRDHLEYRIGHNYANRVSRAKSKVRSRESSEAA